MHHLREPLPVKKNPFVRIVPEGTGFYANSPVTFVQKAKCSNDIQSGWNVARFIMPFSIVAFA